MAVMQEGWRVRQLARTGAEMAQRALVLALLVAALSCAAKAGSYEIPDAELINNFVVEWGGGALTKVDVAGPGLEFRVTVPSKTGLGDNWPVGAEAGLDWDPVLHHWTSLAGYASITMTVTYTSGPPGSEVDLHLFMNTGLTGPSGFPSNDLRNNTFWGGPWVSIPVGQTRLLVLDFAGAEAYNITDNPLPHTGGGQNLPDGQIYQVNLRDRNEISHIGLEVADFDGDTGGQQVVLHLNPPQPVTFEVATANDLDWVYQNTPGTLANGGHRLPLTVTVTDLGDNTRATVAVAKLPASGPGEVTIEDDPGGDPMVKHILGGLRSDGIAGTGQLVLEVTVSGDVTGAQTAVLPFTARRLGDVDGNGGAEPGDVSALILALNGTPVAGVTAEAVDLDANGGAEPGDVSILINVLNGLPIP